jgi:hypothetical protein
MLEDAIIRLVSALMALVLAATAAGLLMGWL